MLSNKKPLRGVAPHSKYLSLTAGQSHRRTSGGEAVIALSQTARIGRQSRCAERIYEVICSMMREKLTKRRRAAALQRLVAFATGSSYGAGQISRHALRAKSRRLRAPLRRTLRSATCLAGGKYAALAFY